jgi:hypothetical protein
MWFFGSSISILILILINLARHEDAFQVLLVDGCALCSISFLALQRCCRSVDIVPLPSGRCSLAHDCAMEKSELLGWRPLGCYFTAWKAMP